MRIHIRNFIKCCSRVFDLQEDIYEFGSYQVTGQETLANLRPIFPNKKYYGCDMREGNGVDLVKNLMDIKLDDGIAGTVLCFDTYEHVKNPILATKEIYRILHKDGIFLFSSAMNYPIHAYPSDYWRFTPDAFRYMLEPFANKYVSFGGKAAFPHTVVGIGFKSDYGFDKVKKLKTLINPIIGRKV